MCVWEEERQGERGERGGGGGGDNQLRVKPACGDYRCTQPETNRPV